MSGKAGYIYKEGAKVLNWKKRFLVCEKDKITYYVKDNMKDKKGEIAVRTITDVKPFKEYKSRKFVFGIVTTTGRTFYVQGSDQENTQSWVNYINILIGKGAPTTTSTPTPTPVASAGPSTTASATVSAGNSGNNNNVSTGGKAPQPAPAGHETKIQTPQAKVGLDDFIHLKVIGRGGFGRVLLVKKRDTGKVYAMKELKKSTIAARGEIFHTLTEKSVLSKMEHPFLAKLHWSFQTADKLYFILDFINGGELFHHLSREKRFNEERARFYAAEIIAGMEHLHKNGVIYRDLKPENLLLSNKGHIIMTDFGLSKEGLNSNESSTSTFCGTPEYLAPEIIEGSDYTKAIDWWSVGTLIYEMLTGLPPFYTEEEEQMYQKILTADLVIPSFFSPEVADLIKKFLQRDPAARLQEPEHIRSHPWFAPIDWNKLENLELEPPFKPNVKSSEDVGNIDDEFLQEDVNAEDEDEDGGKVAVKKDDFYNFTFQAQDAGQQ